MSKSKDFICPGELLIFELVFIEFFTFPTWDSHHEGFYSTPEHRYGMIHALLPSELLLSMKFHPKWEPELDEYNRDLRYTYFLGKLEGTFDPPLTCSGEHPNFSRIRVQLNHAFISEYMSTKWALFSDSRLAPVNARLTVNKFHTMPVSNVQIHESRLFPYSFNGIIR